MKTVHRLVFKGLAGGALLLAAAFVQCNNDPPANGGADLSTSNPDLATTPPDLSSALAVTGVSPLSVPIAGGMITLTGTGFKAGATVTIGGVAATNVTVVSETQITATVPAKPGGCGPTAVVVTNPDSQSAMRNDLLRYRANTLSFGTPVSQTMALTPRQVIAADLNKDQKLDLIAITSGAGGQIAIRLGNGDGTFGNVNTSNQIGVGSSPYAIAAVDLNGDGNLDLITANNNSNSIAVRLGTGDGTTFTTPATSTFATAAGPYDIALGDLNGDGKLDVVVPNNGSSNVSVLLGNGDGSFQMQSTAGNATGAQPTAIILADVNNDQKLDFATADSNVNTATVKLGNGNGTFGVGSAPNFASGPTDLVAADFNGDGKLDLALANGGVGTARIALGVGDGTFTAGATPAVSTGGTFRSIATGDFNVDGKPDLAVANSGAGTVSILINNGDATFAAQQVVNVTGTPLHISIADLNRDGVPDLLTTNQTLTTSNVNVTLSQCQ